MPLDALLVSELLCGRNRAEGTIDSTLPTPDPNGLYQVGDVVWNLNPTQGGIAFWQCTAAGTTPTWTAAGISGGSVVTRSVTTTTLASSDAYIFALAGGTITLPAPSTALATHAYNVKAMANSTTITAASASLDGVATGSITLSGLESVALFTDATSWFTVSGREEERQVRTASPPATLTVRDRYVLCPAGQLTLPAPAGWSVGREIIVHATAASVTVTPASGSMNGAAALTLGASANGRIFTDGTNFFTAN